VAEDLVKLSIPMPCLRVALRVAFSVALLVAGTSRASAPGFRIDPGTAFSPPGRAATGFHLSDLSLLSPGRTPVVSPLFGPDPARSLGLGGIDPIPGRWTAEIAPAEEPHRRDKSWLVAGSFSAAFLGLEYLAFWASSSVSDDFQWANEGWFDPDTYTGGADKGSHLIGGYIAGRLLESALLWGGTRPEKAQFLSAAMIVVTGSLIEVGDAYHGFGASWQDALITAAGGVAGSLLAHAKLDDTITMRFGKVGVDEPNDASLVTSDPNHYSGEIYTVDLRLAGLLPRMGRSPGAARFLLASLTYGTKGYPWVEEPYRQRRIGFEIALDTYEIGRALGIRPDSWWGGPTLAFLRYFRLPFTGIGFQYELNSRRWMGPNSFYSYDR
jgi:hypothetical protein